jgi:gliding motility-associated-like protein
VYRIRIQDQCGFDYTTVDVPGYEPLNIADSILTCSDFSMHSIPAIFTPPVHYSVFDQATLVDSATADHPFFFHLPPATYTVTATQPLCLAASLTVKLPAIGGSCIVPMFDSACTPGYAIYQNLTNYTEVYSLVSTLNGATYVQTIPTPYPGAALFDAVPPGSYNLVSDSGCSVPYTLPAFPQHVLTATSTHQCTGASLIVATCTPPISSCNTSQGAYYVLRKNNQFIAGSNVGRFSVLDTGYYVIDLFLSNTTIFNFNVRYDTICPLETVLVYVSGNVVPNIVSTQTEVCGHVAADIPYTIFGGTPPYTVQILGYPTRTDSLPHDTFPDVYPGVYTMIVSDFCGISRSFSVSVIDTCSLVCDSDIAAFTLSDSIVCRGATTTMANHSSGATHYTWDINGTTYAYITDTSFHTSVPGAYTITLYAYVGRCADTVSHLLSVQDTLHIAQGRDTTLCSPFALQLNSHVANTIWSSGTTDSVVTVTTPGTYIASVSNACGSATDTIRVATFPEIMGFELTDTRDYLCESIRDSVGITASIDSSGGQPVSFVWSTGVSDTPAYSSTILVYEAGTYQIRANNGFCPIVQSITIDSMSCDSECIAGIAVPDIFSPNGDGKNDTFYILHLCDINPFEMHIYDRFGMLVFESLDISKGWDGKYKGNPEPEEVYWLWLQLTQPDGRIFYRGGNVTLVR